jgi:hypothetical protein
MSSDSKYNPDICNALLKYYNTSILSRLDMDSDLKESLYKCADDNMARKDNSLERTVLKELISSHENQQNSKADPKTQKPLANFIGGPYTLTLQWSAKYKKLIYIFGETHYGIPDCPKEDPKEDPKEENKIIQIEDYILQLYKNGDSFIDLYIETGAHFKNQKPYSIISDHKIGILRNIFNSCLKNINSEECRKGRVHYFDIRKIRGLPYPYFRITNYVSKYHAIFNKINNKNLIEFFTNLKVSTMITDISKMETEEDFIPYVKEEFGYNYLYEKELRKSDIKQEINSFINTILVKYKDYIISIIKGIQELNILLEKFKIKRDYEYKYEPWDEYEEEETDHTFDFDYYSDKHDEYDQFTYLLNKKIFENLISIESLLVDSYLLARVFKKFDIDVKDEKKPRNTDEPDEPHNIIIYAGNSHSNLYRDFLDKKLGFELIALTGPDWREPEPSETEKEYGYCIDMNKFPQPFFENHDKVDWFEDLEL